MQSYETHVTDLSGMPGQQATVVLRVVEQAQHTQEGEQEEGGEEEELQHTGRRRVSKHGKTKSFKTWEEEESEHRGGGRV